MITQQFTPNWNQLTLLNSTEVLSVHFKIEITHPYIKSLHKYEYWIPRQLAFSVEILEKEHFNYYVLLLLNCRTIMNFNMSYSLLLKKKPRALLDQIKCILFSILQTEHEDKGTASIE